MTEEDNVPPPAARHTIAGCLTITGTPPAAPPAIGPGGLAVKELYGRLYDAATDEPLRIKDGAIVGWGRGIAFTPAPGELARIGVA